AARAYRVWVRSLPLKLAEGRDRIAPLFIARTGRFHARDWPRERAQAICREIGIPPMTAHGLRGFNSSALTELGVDLERLQRHLGHEDQATTKRSYVASESLEKARQERTLRVLERGRAAMATA